MNAPQQHKWTLDLASPPEALWPFVANTERFNKDTGLPTVERLDAPPAGLGRPMRIRVYGLVAEWIEQPFEWVEPRCFSIRRDYTRGPIRRIEARLTLEPRAGGSRLTYEVDAQPIGTTGRAIAAIQIGRISAARFMRAFRRYDALAQRGGTPATIRVPNGETEAAPPVPAPLQRAAQRLAPAARSPALVARLLDHVANADDAEAARLRPYVLADRWHAPRRELLELMLHATRAGLLELRWDLMCPFCRGSKRAAPALRELPRGVHCDACHIDFESSFDRLVELTFRPSPSIRTIVDREYCIGGPMVTPHIVLQQVLAPGESRTLDITLRPGDHRLRTRSGMSPEPDRPGPMIFAAHDGDTHATLSGPTWRANDIRLALNARITLANTAPDPRAFIIERLAWTDDAVTAAQVTSMQTFRDLFSSEALRPGEQASVGSIALLFTDLKDSTRLYNQIGDAPAFGRVMSHFDVLRQAVAAEGGAVVKTMGDAVMASFIGAGPAVRAAIAAHRLLETQAGAGVAPLRLKAAVHFGPCIAVTLNDRLDYFGSTVNIAARLVTAADAGEVVVSDEALADPSLASLLSAGSVVCAHGPRRCTFKGVEGERAAHPLIPGAAWSECPP